MPSDQGPSFPTYLLPSISFPFRRRQQSTSSTFSDISDTAPSLSFSPTSSPATTPSCSPPTPHFIHHLPGTAKSLLHEALQAQRTSQTSKELRLSLAQPNILKCATCATDIAFASQIVSRGFTGRHGRAYLVSAPPREPYSASSKKSNPTELVNTRTGRSVNRELLTGAHVVADVTCIICLAVLGWKYVDAKEQAQRYKIGKFILETKRVVAGVNWEDRVVEEDEDEDEEEQIGGERERTEANEDQDDLILFNSEDEDECEDLFAGVWNPELVAKRRGRRVGRSKVDVSS